METPTIPRVPRAIPKIFPSIPKIPNKMWDPGTVLKIPKMWDPGTVLNDRGGDIMKIKNNCFRGLGKGGGKGGKGGLK